MHGEGGGSLFCPSQNPARYGHESQSDPSGSDSSHGPDALFFFLQSMRLAAAFSFSPLLPPPLSPPLPFQPLVDRGCQVRLFLSSSWVSSHSFSFLSPLLSSPSLYSLLPSTLSRYAFHQEPSETRCQVVIATALEEGTLPTPLTFCC